MKKEIVEELWEYQDGSSLELFDKYDGIGYDIVYKKLVINDPKIIIIKNESEQYFLWYNVIIERCPNRPLNCGNDFTFTEFKKNNHPELTLRILEELNLEWVKTNFIKGKLLYYKFNKPVILRAQNSICRTGYGSEWHWSEGYGDILYEGRQYGETNTYIISGIYISKIEKL